MEYTVGFKNLEAVLERVDINIKITDFLILCQLLFIHDIF